MGEGEVVDIRPDITRLGQLDLSGFGLGDQILFCPVCPWQASGPQGQAPFCPACSTRLHLTKVTPDLIALKDCP